MMSPVVAASLTCLLFLAVAGAPANQTGSPEVCRLPAVTGPCRAYFPRWYYDADAKVCKEFIYGGCGGNANNFETVVECSAACNQAPEVCRLPAVSGLCLAYFPRWYYDAEAKVCKEFIYGGCGGNANNFETEVECSAACNQAPTLCSLPAITGPCKAAFPRWYYDAGLGQCKRFVYGGCQGNENNFEAESKCLATCTRRSCKKNRN